jgi:DNA-binding transcriptional regulator YiaG
MAIEHLHLLSYKRRGLLTEATVVESVSTLKKNTRKMTKVNKKTGGRPRRSDSEVDLEALGKRIRHLRELTTQEEFARALGISQAQLSKYELGQSAVPLSVLIKLVKRSGKSANWILMGTS